MSRGEVVSLTKNAGGLYKRQTSSSTIYHRKRACIYKKRENFNKEQKLNENRSRIRTSISKQTEDISRRHYKWKNNYKKAVYKKRENSKYDNKTDSVNTDNGNKSSNSNASRKNTKRKNDINNKAIMLKSTFKQARKSVKIATKTVKYMAKGIVLIVSNWRLALAILLCVIMLSAFGTNISILAVNQFNNSSKNNENDLYAKATFSKEVEKYRSYVQKVLENNGLDLKYTNLVLAIIAQESGGNEKKLPDIMQSSESQGWKPNTIKDPKKSIDIGIKYLKSCFDKAAKLGITDIRAILQSYNYGPGFLNYVKNKNNGKWTEQVSKDFAKTKSSTGNYGDYKYADKVMSYLEESRKDDTDNNKKSDFIWPLKEKGRITCNFGYRKAPTAGASTYHKGIDIGVKTGTTIVAIEDGEVTYAGYKKAEGNYIQIKHSNGIASQYMHCSKLSVSKGDKVSKGQKIGEVGSTGVSTGPHLHLGIKVNGTNVDPKRYVSY